MGLRFLLTIGMSLRESISKDLFHMNILTPKYIFVAVINVNTNLLLQAGG